MQVSSGSSFFRPTTAQGGQTPAPRAAAKSNAVLQAQATKDERRAQAAQQAEAHSPAARNSCSPRGTIIDIIA